MLDTTKFPAPTFVDVDGVTLEVFEAGQEKKGNPIVLCHGWPEHAFSWRHQMPALAAAGYHVIVPNQRGYGNSSCPSEVTDYDISHLTGDIAALLDHFGYDDTIFVGHDWGANVVWACTNAMPCSNPSTIFIDRMLLRYSVSQSATLAAVIVETIACACVSPRSSHPSSALTIRGRNCSAIWRSITMHSVAPQMPVRRILAF